MYYIEHRRLVVTRVRHEVSKCKEMGGGYDQSCEGYEITRQT